MAKRDDITSRVEAAAKCGRDMADWVVERYRKDGPYASMPDPDAAAIESIKHNEALKQKILSCDKSYVAAFNAYMDMNEAVGWRLLTSLLSWERKVMDYLMFTDPVSITDPDERQKMYKLGCDLGEEAVKLRKRIEALQAEVAGAGQATERAARSVAIAEGNADRINRLKNGTAGS